MATPAKSLMADRHSPAPPNLKAKVEREVKGIVDADFRLPHLGGTTLPRRILTSLYFDTVDHRLGRLGLTLRQRRQQGKVSWQLKLPVKDGRREIEMPDTSGKPPGQITEALVAILEGQPLVPICQLRTVRSGLTLRLGRSGTAEVVLDSVSVIDNDSIILRFREVEVEWSNGDQSSIQPIIDCLQQAGARSHDGRPKLFRALSLFYDRPGTAPANAPVTEHLRQDLNRQCYVLRQCDPGVRLERDPADLHDMRVAARRMRAVLKAASQIVAPVWVEPLLSGLQWLGHILGHGRDLDVQIEYFIREMQQLKGEERRPIERFLARLQAERARYQQKLIDEMNGARYLGFLTTLQKAADDPAVVDPEYRTIHLARRQFQKLKHIVNNLRASPSDKDLHRVRICAKRVRYAAELAKACDRKHISRFVKAAKRFQELLGAHQDAVLAEQYISDVLRHETGKRLAFTAGLLVARARQRRTEARERFSLEWKRFKKKGRQLWK